jgi:hypothetical protein
MVGFLMVTLFVFVSLQERNLRVVGHLLLEGSASPFRLPQRNWVVLARVNPEAAKAGHGYIQGLQVGGNNIIV